MTLTRAASKIMEDWLPEIPTYKGIRALPAPPELPIRLIAPKCSSSGKISVTIMSADG